MSSPSHMKPTNKNMTTTTTPSRQQQQHPQPQPHPRRETRQSAIPNPATLFSKPDAADRAAGLFRLAKGLFERCVLSLFCLLLSSPVMDAHPSPSFLLLSCSSCKATAYSALTFT